MDVYREVKVNLKMEVIRFGGDVKNELDEFI